MIIQNEGQIFQRHPLEHSWSVVEEQMESAGHRHEVDISPHSFDHTINTLSASRLPGLDVSGIDSEHIEGCVEGHTGMSSHNSLESITNSLYNIQNGRASSPLGHSPIPMNQLENIGSFGQHSPVSGSINDDLEYSKKQLQSYQSQSPNSQTLTPRTSTPVSSGKRRFPCRDPTCDQTFSTSGHLSRHMKLHTGELPHVCPILYCESMFSRRDNMMQHYVSHQRKLLARNETVHHKSDSAPKLTVSFEAKCKSITKTRGTRKRKPDPLIPLQIPSSNDALNSALVSSSLSSHQTLSASPINANSIDSASLANMKQHLDMPFKILPKPRRSRGSRLRQKSASFVPDANLLTRPSLSTPLTAIPRINGHDNPLNYDISYTYQLHNDHQINSPLSIDRPYGNNEFFARTIARPNTVDPLEISHYMSLTGHHDPSHQVLSPMMSSSSADVNAIGNLGRSSSSTGYMTRNSIHLPIPTYGQNHYLSQERPANISYATDFTGMLSTPQSLIHSIHPDLDSQTPPRSLNAHDLSTQNSVPLMINHVETPLSVCSANNSSTPPNLAFLHRSSAHMGTAQSYCSSPAIDSTLFIPQSLIPNLETNGRNEFEESQLRLPHILQQQQSQQSYYQPQHHYGNYELQNRSVQSDFGVHATPAHGDFTSAYTSGHERQDSFHSFDSMHQPQNHIGIAVTTCTGAQFGSADVTPMANWLMYQQTSPMLTLNEQQHADMNAQHQPHGVSTFSPFMTTEGQLLPNRMSSGIDHDLSTTSLISQN
ncbi:hypothetical protein BATDEDRAFT_22333 [Batrachochytrium dendrobatidis JAM81]|uniref:C2H2-type domain-containing protein n=1 Tax=Batrachochytrium dendrobatidis (strain JAM81 / FGSC 10211) TaxID=684364 RepID=F4NTV3_BATDJ|nr:uncharacterized protein BATDEDRAFT_22333 [Batrachochytrium dendrobatidis JAM81]EGF83546.1 hypothetical protein BATDEDRAFT_22333 [Batrachochytrium dendrobatidis JAM81]KAK5667890.1 hypothetical protein QVD99_004942 [Batrachochytrium dendrobatidis]|eukprot:XP_006675536.1 hypothetical protein BATDEDRAFT_22333 [Batrachochytrium dendrobatidis JAM81]